VAIHVRLFYTDALLKLWPKCYINNVVMARRQCSRCAVPTVVWGGDVSTPVFQQHRLMTPYTYNITQRNTHTRLTALCPGLPGWAGTRKVKPVWILLKQEAVSGSGISWAICKSAPCSRQITTSAPHHSVFYRPDALPATQPTASKHWRQI